MGLFLSAVTVQVCSGRHVCSHATGVVFLTSICVCHCDDAVVVSWATANHLSLKRPKTPIIINYIGPAVKFWIHRDPNGSFHVIDGPVNPSLLLMTRSGHGLKAYVCRSGNFWFCQAAWNSFLGLGISYGMLAVLGTKNYFHNAFFLTLAKADPWIIKKFIITDPVR